MKKLLTNIVIIICGLVAIYANWFMENNKIIIPSCFVMIIILALVAKNWEKK